MSLGPLVILMCRLGLELITLRLVMTMTSAFSGVSSRNRVSRLLICLNMVAYRLDL